LHISKVDQHGAHKMTVQGERLDGDYAVVRTTLLLSSRHELAIDYSMHSTDDRWRVYDLSIDGISLVVAKFKSHPS
jgi:phospholipid transport system substrate-binding protein